jgi:Cdc6-like AAA superfamily ATPase
MNGSRRCAQVAERKIRTNLKERKAIVSTEASMLERVLQNFSSSYLLFFCTISSASIAHDET